MIEDLEAYITIHDQDLIIEAEEGGRFNSISHTYLFVGPRPTDAIPDDVKVIVSRDYPDNYEHLPQFYDFTGWHTLYKHRLINAPYSLMIQYDHTPLVGDVVQRCVEALSPPSTLVGFVAGYYNNWYLQVPDFQEVMRAASLACGFDLTKVDEPAVFNKWPSTQGTAWRTDYFYEFMSWFEPAFDILKDHVLAGHAAERLVSVFATNTTPVYLEGMFSHASLDCHGTGDLMRGDFDAYRSKKAAFAYQSS